MTSDVAHAFLDETAHIAEIVGAQATTTELTVFTNLQSLRITGSYRGLAIVTKFTGELLVEQPLLAE